MEFQSTLNFVRENIFYAPGCIATMMLLLQVYTERSRRARFKVGNTIEQKVAGIERRRSILSSVKESHTATFGNSVEQFISLLTNVESNVCESMSHCVALCSWMDPVMIIK